MLSTDLSDKVRQTIRNIPDFPKTGILFRDFTPVLKDAALFSKVVDWMVESIELQKIDYIIGIESRGFILGIPLAQRLGVGFIPARKRGKLPGDVEQHHYDLEYGTDCIEMQRDAFEPGSRVIIVDDLLATGGTANATVQLVEKLGGHVARLQFMVELAPLNGRKVFANDLPIDVLVSY